MAAYSEVRLLPIDSLVVSPQQVRTRSVRKHLDELIDNIRTHGQLEPIIVAPAADTDNQFEIVAGQRRWLAMKELGADRIMCAILDSHLDETTATVLSLSENFVRHDVDVNDLIDTCTTLYRKYGSLRAVAQELGLSQAKVRNYVKYDRLRDDLKAMVLAGRIDLKTALKIDDYIASAPSSPTSIDQIVNDVATMTNVQQRHYFQRLRAQSRSNPARSNETLKDAQPGHVHQLIVTLTITDHADLRAWAQSQKLTQDQAAAQIIKDFLRMARQPSHSPVQH